MEYSLAAVFRIMSFHDSNRVPFGCVFRWGTGKNRKEPCRESREPLEPQECCVWPRKFESVARNELVRCHEAVSTLSAWTNHRSKWNVPNQCLSPPPSQVLGRWHDGPAWPKSALGQWARHFGLLRAYRNERRSPPTCGHLWIGLALLNLCDAHGIVAENPLNLPNGFHFLNRPCIPYHITSCLRKLFGT